jgi:hypothetical protein
MFERGELIQMWDENKKKAALIIIGVVTGVVFLLLGTILHLPKFELEFRISLLVIGSVILLVTFICVVISTYCSKTAGAARPGECPPAILDQIETRTLRNVVVGAGVLVFATFVWAGTFVIVKWDQAEVTLPVIIIAGLVVLVMVLGLLTFVFSVLKLSDSKEALGLPSGSIRAVIALMLLVIFAIVAIFLYSDVSSSGRLQEIKNVQNEQQETELRKQFDVLYAVPVSKDAKYPTSLYHRTGSKAAEDLAKQLIVLLGTLVTAVSSFYFGSSSIAAATKPTQTGGPNAKAVTPTNLNPDGTAQSLTVTGTNLNNVGAVKLTFDTKPPISASAVVAGEASVSCKVTIPPGTDYGPWNVVVSDNANNDSSVPNSVMIGTKPQPAATVPNVATITSVDVTSITPGPNPQPMTITGTNLGKVTGAKLLMTGKPDIDADASGFTPGDKQVKCNFTVKPGTDPGDREVALFEGANKVATAQTKVKIG